MFIFCSQERKAGCSDIFASLLASNFKYMHTFFKTWIFLRQTNYANSYINTLIIIQHEVRHLMSFDEYQTQVRFVMNSSCLTKFGQHDISTSTALTCEGLFPWWDNQLIYYIKQTVACSLYTPYNVHIYVQRWSIVTYTAIVIYCYGAAKWQVKIIHKT